MQCPQHQDEQFVFININPSLSGNNRLMCCLCLEDYLNTGGQKIEVISLNQFLSKPFEQLFKNKVRRQIFHNDYAKYLSYTSIEFDKVQIYINKILEWTGNNIKTIVDQLSILLQEYITEILKLKQIVAALETSTLKELQFQQTIDCLKDIQPSSQQKQIVEFNKKMDDILQTIQLNSNPNIKMNFKVLQKQLDICEKFHSQSKRSILDKLSSQICQIFDINKYKIVCNISDQYTISNSQITNQFTLDQRHFLNYTVMREIERIYPNPTFELALQGPKLYQSFMKLNKDQSLNLWLIKLKNGLVLGMLSQFIVEEKFKNIHIQADHHFVFSITNQEIYPKKKDIQQYIDIDRWKGYNNDNNLKININKDIVIGTSGNDQDYYIESMFPDAFSIENSRYGISKDSYLIGSKGKVQIAEIEVFQIK